ncbi:MAG: hypothetical protein L6R36_004324 [Xanthoria steineri]|nr:MAG: hypothetical protein L6R36_004324 [Xanthoria steineri]
MSGFRTGAAIRRIIVSTLMFAPFNASLRKRLGIDGLWKGYTPAILLSIGIFEVVMLSGQIIQYLYQKINGSSIDSPPHAGSRKSEVSMVDQVKAMYHDFRHQRYYKPFLREKPIIIESRDQMEELSHAPELSQPAVYADIFGFKYTLKDEETNSDPLDTAGARFRLFARTIKVIGTTELESLRPHLQGKIEEGLEKAIANGKVTQDGWTSIETTPTMRDTASDPLALYMFGRTLTENPKFLASLKKYYMDTIAYQGAMQFFPRFLEGYMFSRTTQDGQALKDLITMLKDAMGKPDGGWEEDESLKRITLMYHMIDASRDSSYWTPNIVVQALIGIWFAAAHQPWVNLDFAFLELCQRPEYIDLIRHEISSKATLDATTISNEMPVLDSFLKESMRLNPMDDLAIRRKSLSPYTFRSGTPHIPTGTITSVSSYNLMHDPDYYPNPNHFDGLRYTRKRMRDDGEAEREIENPMYGDAVTEVKREFPVWGFGGHVCPGRYHAALVLKMVLIHLLRDYEFKLAAPGQPWKWWWDNLAMPYQGTRVFLRRRGGGGGG